MNAQELEQYKQELMAEHHAEIAALDRLITRERGKPATGSSANGAGRGVAGVDTLPRVPPMVRIRRSAAGLVKEAVMQMPQRFTRKDVGAFLGKSYPNSPLPTRTVAVELWKLAQANEIETIKEGRGRIPARYRRK